ncbi:MAG: tRNA 2-selenouridine(34) synthase MnmH [Bacteroidetes bacterium]|nr:tRNA 2-selenouridine(34) synthase MnmH [Bacteroidota bacterium]
MYHFADAATFIRCSDQVPVVDVRSPLEYSQGHIPGAFNIPLFNDEERARVGTLYRQSGSEAAVLLGLDLAGVNLSRFVKEAKKIAPEKEVLVHCWRGGMRSASMAWLLDLAGFKTTILEGGYKSYRHYIRHRFSCQANIMILGGMTGSGKSDILRSLASQGEQVLDLEGHACHKGSAFGAIGQQKQPTNEQFENNLFNDWRNFDFSKPVWIEDESRGIGTVSIPETLWENMLHASVIEVVVPKSDRIQRLVQEYASFDKHELEAAILRIRQAMGFDQAQLALDALRHDDFATVAEITLTYYDKTYLHHLQRRKEISLHTLELPSDDPEKNATQILAFARQISKK